MFNFFKRRRQPEHDLYITVALLHGAREIRNEHWNMPGLFYAFMPPAGHVIEPDSFRFETIRWKSARHYCRHHNLME